MWVAAVTLLNETDVVERLARIAGAAHVTAMPELAAGGLRPAAAVSPGTPEEAAAVLLAAREAGAAVAPWGGGTQQRTGAPPARLDVVLHTRRWSSIVEWEPADLTVSVGAGITLAAVQAALAAQGQEIPIDAPCADRATLGGLVAVNTSGPRRWLHGSWRDLIVGMHMALADGSVIKSGGRVVKNVQGYDLGKLFTGSLGTLGVIALLNLKLAPLAPARRLLAGRGPLAAVTAFLDSVAASTARVATLDLLDEAAARACGLAGGGYAGLVLVEERPAVADALSAQVGRLAAGAGVRCEAVDDDALGALWRAWVDLGRTDDLGAAEALFTVSALPAEVGDAVQEVERTAGRLALSGRIWARAGNGLVYARLDAAGQDAPAALAAAQAALLGRWPATTVTAGDPAVARAARPWGHDPAGLTLMRSLKVRFDPAAVLQPGRYVGGM